jgi:hypothetical protein
MMGEDGPIMEMIVVQVDDNLIYCDAVKRRPMKGKPLEDHWMFDRDQGIEEDADLGWGKKFGKTGTRLVTKN